jgi:anti-sigma B factor antagonist
MQPPLTSTTTDSGPLVRVACRLDAEGAEVFTQEIDRLLRVGEHAVQLDLAAVTFVSSAGIGALVAAHKKLKAAGGALEVVDAGPQVRGVLKLTKLDTLIGPFDRAAAPTAPTAAARAERVVGDVRLVALTPPARGAAVARVVGDRQPPALLELGPGSFAVGLGTPDAEDAAPLAHAGELVVAAGCLFHRPPAADPRIDWVVAHDGHSARAAVVEGLAWHGGMTGSAGFEPTDGRATVLLDGLGRAMLDVAGPGPVGFVAVGEIHGLVGAELVRPLAEATADDHPRAGTAAVATRWLSFSREPAHARRTAIVVGVVGEARPDVATLAATLRPLDPAGDRSLVGHVHAAVFPFRPVRREPGAAAELIAAVAATPPLAVMHLLGDPAPLVGSGRSEFVRGVVWFGPLDVGREGGA